MKGSISHNKALYRNLVNKLFAKAAGGDRRPRFFSTKTIFPEGLAFEKRFAEIQNEIHHLTENRVLTRYQDIDAKRSAEVSNDWRLYYIYFLKKTNEQAKKDCPVILDIVQRIPHAINATIALLEPGVELAPHCGPYAGMLRYHLGIRIPKNNPPSIRVDKEWYTWQEGKSIVLDDVFEHEVVNKSDETRIILMIDFLRPMNKLYHQLNYFSMVWLNRHWAEHFINTTNNKSRENIHEKSDYHYGK